MAGFEFGDGDALLVIDVQLDFCAAGSLAVPGGDAVVPVVNRLAGQFRHVILTQDWHPPDHRSFVSAHPGKKPFETVALPYGQQVLWPDHCVQGARGAEFHPGLRVPQAELILRKGFRADVDSYSAFFENDRATPTGLTGYLRERGFRRLFLAGLALDYCVRFSAEDAVKGGFAATVIGDACRGIGDDTTAAARRSFAALGVSVVQSESVGAS